MLKGKTVLLGVTGGIACYKSAGLASALVKQGANVQVLMTRNATEFIGPHTFESLTGNRVSVDTFDRNYQFQVEHIALADQADLVLVAPATANVLAKLAHGLADDMLTTTVLACDCPKIAAPAMNTRMYENPVTQDNLALLRRYGWEIVEPASGRLACGAVGKGKMPEPEELLETVLHALSHAKDMEGLKVLVTAGPTQEALDPVRCLTNHSTGRMGYAVARAAAALAYFLILTLFPLLMCVNFFIGLLPLSPEDVFSALDSILPRESLSLILDYLDYVSAIPQSQSTPLLLACLFTIGLSASAGLRTLLQTMDELYQVRRINSLHRLVLSVSLSLLFLLTIYLSIVVIFTGEWFFRLLESRLPQALLDLVPLVTLSQLWGWLRYLLLFLLVLVLVLAVYRLGTPLPFRRRTRTLYLTALLSAAALVACSVLFSWFIGMSSRYSLVYGSLASLIILLVWLYFCGNILLLGAVAGRVWGQLRIPSGDD